VPRLAWFTPLPPGRSGIAAYSAELLPLLSSSHAVDVFTSPAPGPESRPTGHPPVFASHDFIWKHVMRPYDLIVYQLGNAMCHSFMWPYLFRYPGLVVLHDAQLHHSRAQMLLVQGRRDDYMAEFDANHPGAPEGLARLFMENLAGAAYYLWPMVNLVVERARIAAVHSPRVAEHLAAQCGRDVAAIRMGVADPAAGGALSPARRRAVRARHGLDPDAPVFAAFGLVTPEKRLSEALRALVDVVRVAPAVHLLLVGATADHYDVDAEARALGVADRLTVTGYVPDGELPGYLAAADACLCLRWPTGGETSASLLRALAAGRPTIITDLAHTDDIPSLDPRTWTDQTAWRDDSADRASRPPVCVSVDLLDERHSLGLAMRRLATDAMLRERLGRAAREHWATRHTLGCMEADYQRVIAAALEGPAPAGSLGLPAHLRADGTEQVRRMATELGVDIDFLRA
jgi:glycosyltransferase involved in cell wall biosynthesis